MAELDLGGINARFLARINMVKRYVCSFGLCPMLE